jgi:NADH-quinone oxidoreductase subunit H
LFVLLLLLLLPTILLERLFLGAVQNRFGSNISGLFGLLQSSIDGFKTFFKQILLIKTLAKFNFIFLPMLSLFINYIRILIVPFSSVVEIFDFTFDIILFYLLSGIDALVLVLAISSVSKSIFSKLSIAREITQLCTLEIALGICFLTIATVAGTTNIRGCIVSQNSC